MPVDFDDRRPGANPAEQRDAKSLELSNRLDEICSAELPILERAIRYMGANTRETLKRVLEMAERNK